MKLGISIAAASAAAIVGSAAFAVPVLASTATHTLQFFTVTKAEIGFSATSAGIQQTDVSKAGKIVGFDEIWGTEISKNSVANSFVVDTSGGLLYGKFVLNTQTEKVTDGTVTGGTGTFKNATGTLTDTPVSHTETAVKITYST